MMAYLKYCLVTLAAFLMGTQFQNDTHATSTPYL